MKERPILFSTEMVRAILDGRGTQTRRTRGLSFIEHIPFGTGLYKEPYQKEDGQWYYQVQTKVDDSQENLLKCPYGQIGDVLWVRETWLSDPRGSVDGKSDCFYYKADLPDPSTWNGYWKPSIFMPKAACRIRLQITNIRVERVQNITEADAIAEGIEFWYSDLFQETRYKDYMCPISDWRTPISSYRSLWEKINGKGSWESSPWVWCISFKRCNENKD